MPSTNCSSQYYRKFVNFLLCVTLAVFCLPEYWSLLYRISPGLCYIASVLVSAISHHSWPLLYRISPGLCYIASASASLLNIIKSYCFRPQYLWRYSHCTLSSWCFGDVVLCGVVYKLNLKLAVPRLLFACSRSDYFSNVCVGRHQRLIWS